MACLSLGFTGRARGSGRCSMRHCERGTGGERAWLHKCASTHSLVAAREACLRRTMRVSVSAPAHARTQLRSTGVHTHTHTLSHTSLSRARALALSLSRSLARSLSLALSLSLTHTHQQPNRCRRCCTEACAPPTPRAPRLPSLLPRGMPGSRRPARGADTKLLVSFCQPFEPCAPT